MSASRQPVQHNDSEQQRVLVENPRVFVDFHNADAQGRLRLNCIGTIEDLAAQKIELQAGQHLVLYSEDLEVDGIVEYSQSEHLWVVVIDWDEIREIEENSVQQKLFDFVEKFGSILEILKADTQADSDTDQDTKRYELEKLLDEAKRDLKNARAFLSRDQDISEIFFYQKFAAIFGEEEANEIWSARNWNANIVLRDLTLVLMDDPKLRRNIEQKGFNLEKIINILSQEDKFRKISTELPETNQSLLARLREVICA
ncbi:MULTISPECIES: hypothetical protein [unclassified Nostoc]|uniref:hypothetical protein n=1 Tax=unclassified Nostoc TaxID=2593658 RepID=UPI002AD20D34|nr:hypothetical protein [Nostoc sp. DedQUE03]MDZ7975202.1 hypothetical protein [Nostoc sp. DedQUE03]MDZ8048818.1 hypothetical protein [Nostoc sp. DedQUE02]